jgi:hypothetical protein
MVRRLLEQPLSLRVATTRKLAMAKDESVKYCRTGIGRGLSKYFEVERDLPEHLKMQLLRLRLAERQNPGTKAELLSDNSVLTERMARRELNQYLKTIGTYLPDWFCRAIIWLREPNRHVARFVASLLLILGGFLSFLPVLGFWMLPLGLIIISQDVPFLQRPLVRMFRWADRQLQKLRRRFPRLAARKAEPH